MGREKMCGAGHPTALLGSRTAVGRVQLGPRAPVEIGQRLFDDGVLDQQKPPVLTIRPVRCLERDFEAFQQQPTCDGSLEV